MDGTSSAAKQSSGRSWSRLLLLMSGGVAAGALGWLLIDGFGDHFQVSEETAAAAAAGSVSAAPSLDPAVVEAYEEVARRNRILKMGLMGLALGGVLGCVAVAARAGMRRAILGLVTGAALGALFGAMGGIAAIELFNWLRSQSQIPASLPFLLAHLSAWLCLGAGVGLSMMAVGQSIKRLWGYVTACTVGGVMAVVVQQLVFTIGFPLQNSEPLVPESALLGMVWAMVGGGSIGTALGFVVHRRPVSQPIETPPAM